MLASSEMTYRTVVWVIADVAQLQGHVCVLLDNFVIIVQSRCLAAAFSSQEIIKSFSFLPHTCYAYQIWLFINSIFFSYIN